MTSGRRIRMTLSTGSHAEARERKTGIEPLRHEGHEEYTEQLQQAPFFLRDLCVFVVHLLFFAP